MHPSKLKGILKTTLKKLNLYQFYKYSRLFKIWEKVCGKEVARVTKPLRIRGKTLIVAVKDHIWATEVSHFSKNYIARIEKLLGKGFIKKIKFTTKPSLFLPKEKDNSNKTISLPPDVLKKIDSFVENIKNTHTKELVKKMLISKAEYEEYIKNKGGNRCSICGAMVEKKGNFCTYCLFDMEQKGISLLKEVLEEKPWVSFSQIEKEIFPVSYQTFQEIKKSKIERLYKKIVDDMHKIKKNTPTYFLSDIKLKIIVLAMLKLEKPPAMLKDEILKENLPPFMYQFLKTEEIPR